MQGYSLPPQYHLPPNSLTGGLTGAALAAGAAAAVARTSRSPSPSPAPSSSAPSSSAPSSVGPIPGAFVPSHSRSSFPSTSSTYSLPSASSSPLGRPGTQRKTVIEVQPRGIQQVSATEVFPSVPPPPLPPKTYTTTPRKQHPVIHVPPSSIDRTQQRTQGTVWLPRGTLPSTSRTQSAADTDPFGPNPYVNGAGRRTTASEEAYSRASSSDSSSRAAVEEETPSVGSPSPATSIAGSYRTSPLPAPRRRKMLKAVRSPRSATGYSSPRRDKREPERDRASSSRHSNPTIFATLGYLLVPFRILAWPFKGVLSPVVAHFVNAAILFALLAIVLCFIAGQLRPLAGAFPLITEGVLLPLRTLATPTCLFVNVGCSLSLLSEGNSTAKPFWHLWSSTGGAVDVARVSRSLSSEVRVARDIFDSLLSLGDGRMMEGLAHVRIHELGIAIQTGSTLDERFFIGQELVELADTASSVADEIIKINAMSVSIFSWLFWEFSHIVKLLDLPDGSRPTTTTLAARIDSLVSRLDADLDRLYMRVGAALPVAEHGAQQGWQLHEHLSFVHSDLQAAHESYPGWQRALAAGKRFFAGGDPSKLTRIARDLAITRDTISGITETRNALEGVRIGLVAFRDQVRHFSGSVMGLHLGADAAAGLGPEEELAILSTVVSELGSSVGRAKRGTTLGNVGERKMIDAS